MNRFATVHDALSYSLIGVGLKVHRELGPGFPEDVYKRAMMVEMSAKGMHFVGAYKIDLTYAGQTVGEFNLDLLVENETVVEFLAADAIRSSHERRVVTRLAVAGLESGLLLNFATSTMQYKRVSLPRSVQLSEAFKARRTRFLNSLKSPEEKPNP